MEAGLRGSFLIYLKLNVIAEHYEIYHSSLLHKGVCLSYSQNTRAANRIENLKGVGC